MTAALQPCPFCGEAEELDWTREDVQYRVVCNNCGAQGPWHGLTARGAEELWNQRTVAPAPIICSTCNGKGGTTLAMGVEVFVTCPDCNGAGVRMCADCGEPATVSPTPGTYLCPLCMGGTHTTTESAA